MYQGWGDLIEKDQIMIEKDQITIKDQRSDCDVIRDHFSAKLQIMI